MSVHYGPLNSSKRQTRLLRVVSHDVNDIYCALQVVDLGDQPEYTALSYCWTKDSPSCGIIINGIDFYVRPNLYNSLRLRANEDDKGWIFVDAICINQADVAEKSHQVALMGDVYRGAREVIAWLDDDGNRQPEIEQFASQIQDLCDRGQQLLHSPRVEFDALVKSEWDTVPLIAMSFCNSNYWTRVWILQELMLGRKVTLRTRLLTIDWMTLLLFLNYRFNLQHGVAAVLEPGGGYEHLDEIDNAQSFASIGMTLRSMEQGSDEPEYYGPLRTSILLAQKQILGNLKGDQRIDFRIAISVYASQQCTDLHDKVYGLLGMTRCDVPVDYSTSITELYAHALIDVLMDIVQEAVVSPPLNMEEPIRTTIALLGSLKEGLYFWTAALVTLHVLQALDLSIDHEMMRHLLDEYTPLSRLKRYGVYAARASKAMGKLLASNVLRYLPSTEALMSWAATFKHGDQGQTFPRKQHIRAIYDKALERKFAGRTKLQQIFQQLLEIGDIPLTDACHLIESIAKFPTYAECTDLFEEAFKQILERYVQLKQEQEPDQFDDDVFHACKLYYLRDELLRAIRPRRDWGLRSESSVLESEKRNKESFDSAIDAHIDAGHHRLAVIKELSTARYQTWTLRSGGDRFCATVAQTGLRWSSRPTHIQLLHISLSESNCTS